MTGAMGMGLLWLLSRMGLRPGGTSTPSSISTPTPSNSSTRPSSSSTSATPSVPAEPSLGKYTVQSGDTGQKIATKFTGDPGRWIDLVKANPKIVTSRPVETGKYGFPIYAGDIINLPASWAGLAPTPSIAAAVANVATQTAAKDPTPEKLQTAAKASQQASQVTTATAKQATKAATAPQPWPQAVPKGLPPFPSGWEPDVPVRPEISTRAWQLLPVLWKRGKGATAVETIKGRWITFQAQDHGGGKKGITAYRVKSGGASGTW